MVLVLSKDWALIHGKLQDAFNLISAVRGQDVTDTNRAFQARDIIREVQDLLVPATDER